MNILLALIVIIFRKRVTRLVRAPTRTVTSAGDCVLMYSANVLFVVKCGMIYNVLHKLNSSGAPLCFMKLTYIVGVILSFVLINCFRLKTAKTTLTAVATRKNDFIVSL